jgi:hypothetical protein
VVFGGRNGSGSGSSGGGGCGGGSGCGSGGGCGVAHIKFHLLSQSLRHNLAIRQKLTVFKHLICKACGFVSISNTLVTWSHTHACAEREGDSRTGQMRCNQHGSPLMPSAMHSPMPTIYMKAVSTCSVITKLTKNTSKKSLLLGPLAPCTPCSLPELSWAVMPCQNIYDQNVIGIIRKRNQPHTLRWGNWYIPSASCTGFLDAALLRSIMTVNLHAGRLL